MKENDLETARELYMQSLLILRELDGRRRATAFALAGVGHHASIQQQGQRAVRLYGAMSALCKNIDLLSPIEHDDYLSHLATARSTLSEEAFAAAWEQGQAMTVEQAIEYALEGLAGA